MTSARRGCARSARAEREVDDDRRADAERADDDEDGERDRLLTAPMPVSAIAAAAPTVSSRFFGFTAASRTAVPARLRRREVVDRPHPLRLGLVHVAAAPLLERDEQQQQTEHELQPGRPSSPARCRRSRRCSQEASRTIAPRPPRPATQPTRNAGPLLRARGVESISTMAMIGNGLRPTTDRERKDLPDGLVHDGRLRARAGGAASPAGHEAWSSAPRADLAPWPLSSPRPSSACSSEVDPCSSPHCGAISARGCAAT